MFRCVTSQALFRSSGFSHDILSVFSGKSFVAELSAFIHKWEDGRATLYIATGNLLMALAVQNLQPYHVWNLVCLHMYDKAALEHELNWL